MSSSVQTLGLYHTRKEDKGAEDGADSLGISKWDKEEKGKQTLETPVNPNQPVTSA